MGLAGIAATLAKVAPPLVVAAVVSFLSYRASLPPITSRTRVVLISLRTISLTVAYLMIISPLITGIFRSHIPPTVAVLIDESASMDLPAARHSAPPSEHATRAQQLQDILDGTGGLAERLERKGKMVAYTFSSADRVRPWPTEEPWARGPQTDIGAAIAHLSGDGAPQNLVAAILFTDGANNAGYDPVRVARDAHFAVHAVGLGDTLPSHDVSIVRCICPEVSYLGDRIPIRAQIASRGYEGEPVRVELREGGDVVESEELILAGKEMQQEAAFLVSPTREGLLVYQLHVSPLRGEVSEANNTRSLAVRVRRGKIRVAFFSTDLRWEYTFLLRYLRSDEHVELVSSLGENLFPERHPDETTTRHLLGWKGRGELLEQDIIILGTLDPRALDQGDCRFLTEFVEERGGGLLLLPGEKGVDLIRSFLKDVVPLVAKEGRPVGPRREASATLHGSFQCELTPSGDEHSVTRVDRHPAVNSALWQDLPPLLGIVNLDAKPGARVLATCAVPSSEGAGQDASLPLIVASHLGRGKVLYFNGFPIWRWAFVPWGVGGDDTVYRKLTANVVRWLSLREELKAVRTTVRRPVVEAGETVEISASVWDEAMNPLDGAEVSALYLASDTPGLVLEPRGDGHYSGEIRGLDPGSYRLEVRAAIPEGALVGQDTAFFVVEEYSREFENTGQDSRLLQGIAGASGGLYFSSDEWERIPDRISWSRKIIRHSVHWRPLEGIPAYVLLVVTLAAEWIVRKRVGLM